MNWIKAIYSKIELLNYSLYIFNSTIYATRKLLKYIFSLFIIYIFFHLVLVIQILGLLMKFRQSTVLLFVYLKMLFVLRFAGRRSQQRRNGHKDSGIIGTGVSNSSSAIHGNFKRTGDEFTFWKHKRNTRTLRVKKIKSNIINNIWRIQYQKNATEV